MLLELPPQHLMADSDEEYVHDSSPEETEAVGFTTSKNQTRRTALAGGSAQPARWEEIQRSWDTVLEAADGSISGTVLDLLESQKRRRYT